MLNFFPLLHQKSQRPSIPGKIEFMAIKIVLNTQYFSCKNSKRVKIFSGIRKKNYFSHLIFYGVKGSKLYLLKGFF